MILTKTFHKNIRRSITGSFGRFVAIFAIIFLGVGFLAGLKLTNPVMLSVEKNFIKESNMFDFRMISTIGFTKEDFTELSKEKAIQSVSGSVNRDFIVNYKDSDKVYRAHMITEGINDPVIDRGRMPQKGNECLIDTDTIGTYQIGDKLIVADNNDEETKEFFAYKEYTIVGSCYSPLYISVENGNTSIGNGSLSSYVLIPEDGFDFEYYTECYIKTDNTYEVYSEEYNDYIKAQKDLLMPILEASVTKRFQDELAKETAKLDDAKEELESEWDKANKSFADAKKKLDDGAKALENAKAELDANKEMLGQLERSLMAFPPSTLQYQMMNARYQEGKAQWEAANDTYQKSLKEYQSSLKEYEEQYQSANEEFEDAKKEIEEGYQTIEDLASPELFAITRAQNTGYATFRNDASIVKNISSVLPVFFFLIAALVCSTTMNRMIDDDRSLIGTMCAIGYGKRAIYFKYIMYSGIAATLGCILGYFSLGALFPQVIWIAYRLLYTIPGTTVIFSPVLFVVCLLLSWLCSVGVTVVSLHRELIEMPAEMIRPKTPPAGKRILLERIMFVWNHMKFLHKVTMRNIFRFKKRMIMMVLGIAGCTGLVITGFGIKDSVAGICDYQYEEIMKYDLSIDFTEDIDEETISEIENICGSDLKQYAIACVGTMDVATDGAAKTVNVITSDDPNLLSLIDLHQGRDSIDIPKKEGALIVSNKLCDLVDTKKGSEIKLLKSETDQVSMKIEDTFENYVFNYAFLTRENYESYIDEYHPRTMYLSFQDSSKSAKLATKLSDIKGVANMSVVSTFRSMIAKMMQSLDYVVALVIISAAALAFVVLFNLGNINISERVREIATIKVLGFHQSETGAYVFRENLILSIIGIVLGLPIGKLFHAFVMRQINVEMVSFKTLVKPSSYMLSVALVLLFTVATDLILRRKIKAIDMAESLKSVE